MTLFHCVMMWFCIQPRSKREALLLSGGCAILVLSHSHTQLCQGLQTRDLLAAPSTRTVQLIRGIPDLAIQKRLTSHTFKGQSVTEMFDVLKKCLVAEPLKVNFSKKIMALIQSYHRYIRPKVGSCLSTVTLFYKLKHFQTCVVVMILNHRTERN